MPITYKPAATDTFIGCHPNPPNWWKGMIDEVAVFDTVLTKEEIKNAITRGLEKMNSVSSQGKLVAEWGKSRINISLMGYLLEPFQIIKQILY